jgi:hypothetical protein
MPGYIQNGHMPREFQCVAFKTPGVGAPLIGKAHFDLTDRRASAAFNARDAHLNEHRPWTDGHFPPHPIGAAVVQDIPTAADRARQRTRLGSHGENNAAPAVMAANVTIAFDAPSVVKQTRGHTLTLLSESWLAL